MREQKKRSLAKAISWRCVATATTFIISFIVTGSFGFAASISVIEVIAKILLFYFHERTWDNLKFWRSGIAGQNPNN